MGDNLVTEALVFIDLCRGVGWAKSALSLSRLMPVPPPTFGADFEFSPRWFTDMDNLSKWRDAEDGLWPNVGGGFCLFSLRPTLP